ncbi:MAG: signal recognition particle-docking protein FtsY [Candidatus Thermoplasmatota archaeon]|nr:signal recognition particle-docking protein FtsY [Candidatus Thermoplasmatota archaeon]MBU1940734.1 signal recognition particle-docking protein FtsY [Candidatus Thermoplasmatota archaeon]
MFKFLKKRLKHFEEKLESELENELEKEITKPQEPIPEPPIPTQKPITESEKSTPSIKETPIDVPEPIHRKRARKAPSHEKQKREEELDQQIEQSIENELQRIVQTRRSIEQVVQKEQKATRTIDDAKLDELLWELELGLLESDVAYNVIDSIKKDIREELKHIPMGRSQLGEFIETILRNAIAHVLKSNTFDFMEYINHQEKPIVIMFVGVNGTGKTLSIAKIAHLLKQHKKTCVMAAGDTFRAGAIEQLTIHADNLGVKIIKHGPGADPAAVAFDAIEHAIAKHKDVVLLDTAGRMQTNYNLMDEMAKIKRVAKPNLIIFVGDALSGNDAVEQAKRFNEVVGIDGVVLTKVDTDAKGGSSLSIAYTIGKPLLFVGIGQNYDDQIAFDPEWMLNNLFGT